ncbi:uncharacterized protein LOC144625946 [Crassostrea virginica]
MQYMSTVSKVVFLCVLFVCATNGSHLDSRRVRRQAADIKALDWFARRAMERRPSNCREIGCGIVDLGESGKKKRTETETRPSHRPNYLKIIHLLIPKEQ